MVSKPIIMINYMDAVGRRIKNNKYLVNTPFKPDFKTPPPSERLCYGFPVDTFMVSKPIIMISCRLAGAGDDLQLLPVHKYISTLATSKQRQNVRKQISL